MTGGGRAFRSAPPMWGAGTAKLTRGVAMPGLAAGLGLLLGRVELVVLAVPVLVALAWRLGGSRAPRIDVEVSVSPDRCTEGDPVTVSARVASSRAATLELGFDVPPGFALLEGDERSVVELDPGEPRTVSITARAVRWGVRPLGRLAMRAHGPGRLVVFERVEESAVPVRVHPSFERLHRGVRPPRTQLHAGEYVAPSSGEGIEFAEVRPFAVGDRIRRVNWRVTGRRGTLHVNQFHPERNADVVLFLDTFGDVGPPGATSIDLGVRGAAILAHHYLRHRDRVGLIAFGGLLQWLRATVGQSQIQRIVSYLLEVDVRLSFAWKDIAYLPRRTLPPLALVVAFSPLEDERAVRALSDLRGRRYPVVVVDTLVEDRVEPEAGGAAVAYRAWRLHREAVRFDLVSQGIPVVRWSGEDSLEAALAQVPAFRRREPLRTR